MTDEQKPEEERKVTLSLDQYDHLVQLAAQAKNKPGALQELRGMLRDLYGRINKHVLFSLLVAWEVLFYDKHAKDESPDSIIELIQQLLAAAGNA